MLGLSLSLAVARATGAAGAFLPSNLSGLAAWYDAANGATTDGAAQFASAQSQYLTNPTLKPTGAFGVGGWFYLDAAQANSLVCQFSSLASKLGNFQLQVDSVGGLHFALFDQGVGSTEVVGSMSAGAWTFVAAWYSATSGTINLRVNSGATLSAPLGFTPTFTDAATFAIGARAGNNAIECLRGRADSCYFFGGEFTEAMASDLYANGVGRTYASAPTSVMGGLTSWWDLNEQSGVRNDSKGSNHLTPMGDGGTQPTGAIGIVSGLAGNGDPIKQLGDLSGNGRHLTQSTLAAKPIYATNSINGRPSIAFDGVDDRLAAAFNLPQPFTIVAAMRLPTNFVENTSDVMISNGAGAANNVAIELNGGPVVAIFAGSSNATRPIVLGTNAIVAGVFSNASSLVAVNGSVGAGASGNNTLQGLTVGGLGYNAGVTRFSNLALAELIVYSRALSTSERQQVEQYMSAKYGVALG